MRTAAELRLEEDVCYLDPVTEPVIILRVVTTRIEMARSGVRSSRSLGCDPHERRRGGGRARSIPER